MKPISDALELLTAQHEVIDFLLIQVQQTYDEDAFEELSEKLVAHLALEQELFYPAIAGAMSEDVEDELLAEHAAIKGVLAEMIWRGLDDKEFSTKLAELSILLDGHCAYQEGQLFEVVAETLADEQLSSLGYELQSFDSQILIAA